jgi:hypothetical protein
MKTSDDMLTPAALHCRPELLALAVLDNTLEMTELSLSASHPRLFSSQWPLGSPVPPEPAAYVANLLLTLIEGMRNATRAYRETIMRDVLQRSARIDEQDDDIEF